MFHSITEYLNPIVNATCTSRWNK